MFTELTAGGKTYMLRLTTRGIIQLEKDLGYNPLQIFMGIDEDVLPRLGDMLKLLHRTLQPLNHGITYEDAIDIYDAFLQEDGHTVWDIVPILIDVFKEAGFLPKDEDAAEPKN